MSTDETITSQAYERALALFFRSALRIGFASPRFFTKAVRIFFGQQSQATVRKRLREKGVHVPPFLIFSITQRCNLTCKGCYAHALSKSDGHELDDRRIGEILSEAESLGVSIVLIAGGEPFTRPGILALLRNYPRVVFPLFTNGTLMREETLVELRKCPNIIPIISMEGGKTHTDSRRGEGIYQSVIGKIDDISRAHIVCGVSLTVTRENYSTVTSDGFIEQCLRRGCSVFFFVEYVPVEPSSEHLVLSQEQRIAMMHLSTELAKRYRALFICFPGDEEQFGGCLAAGRGFVHINPAGDVEACPFAPYSDSSLRGMSLKEALNSPILRTIRDHHELLAETKGGCALWENREAVALLTGKL